MLSGCCALAACLVIPQPRDVILLSRVDGRLTSGGQPVAGLALTMNSLHNPAACDDPIARVVTGTDGEFAFDEITTRKSWRVVVLAPSSPTYYMTLCMEDGNDPTPIFAESIWATLPVTLSLHCDLGPGQGAVPACGVTDWTGYNYLSGSGERYREYREPLSPPGDVAGE